MNNKTIYPTVNTTHDCSNCYNKVNCEIIKRVRYLNDKVERLAHEFINLNTIINITCDKFNPIKNETVNSK